MRPNGPLRCRNAIELSGCLDEKATLRADAPVGRAKQKGGRMSSFGRFNALMIASVLSTAALAQGSGQLCGSTGCADDARIRDQVQQQINQSASLRFHNIRVETVAHVVYLKGIVDTRVDRRQANAIARSVPGVERVYNDLVLNGNGG